jgi:lipoate---protein ligase
MQEINLFLSDEYEPWFNLAVEDWIFTEMNPSSPTLFLWRNSDTVVIGRHQNPWTECRLKEMEKDNVYLARRQSGGGAVYHDLNNTNFTLLADKDYQAQTGFSLISRALNTFNVDCRVSGRNDMVVDFMGEERKFSGSAFRKLKDRAFHHGTLLINTDLSRLGTYLTPHKKKLESKGVQSVKSRVVNLSELNDNITHDSLCPEIIREFEEYYQSPLRIQRINRAYMEQQVGFAPLYEKLKSADWNYGKTPPFTHRFEDRLALGLVDVRLVVKGGVIESAYIYSDSLYSYLIDSLKTVLEGTHYDKEEVRTKLTSLIETFPDKKGLLTELSQFIIGEME